MIAFVEISTIIAITAILAGAAKLLKQPLIVGYIAAGLLIGPLFINSPHSIETVAEFSHNFGVPLLLFIIGISLNPTVIKEVGRTAVVIGAGQILFTALIGYAICLFFGIDLITALYISIAITFSSTIIILKLLSDKGDLEKLYGKITIAFLLVQDLIAAVVLLLVSSLTSLEADFINFGLQLLIRGSGILIALYLIGKFILPKALNFFAKSQEFLFLFSVAWGMGIASIFHVAGFSMEIGSLIAGVMFAVTRYNYEISAKFKPLRDFFIILFFVALGSTLELGDIPNVIIPALMLSILVLVGSPLIILILMGLMRYPRRVGFMAGLTVAQISEFSLILMYLGERNGHISSSAITLVAIVGLITIAGSAYLVMYSEKIFPYVSHLLKVFEVSGLRRVIDKAENYDVIQFGYNRIGFDFVKVFRGLDYKFLIVDFDPEVIDQLEAQKIDCLYGDAEDEDFLEELNLKMSQLIVSTVPDYETNILLIKKYKSINPDGIAMVVAHSINDAHTLYDSGADYVVMPHFLGGKYASMIVSRFGFDRKLFERERNKHIQMLIEREQLGQDHPNAARYRS